MQASTSPKKPSPLSFGSPRTSPFRRPDSTLDRSPSTIRAKSPPHAAPVFTLSPPPTTSSNARGPTIIEQIFAPLPQPQRLTTLPSSARERAAANIAAAAAPSPARSPSTSHTTSNGGGDALSRLHPAQVRELRESFQVLDRNNDGQVTRDDVAEVLGQLGLDTTPSSLSPYFLPSSPSTLSLATYLSTLSSLLSSLSPPAELTAAFAAFDVDDSGQIDINELREALLSTPPEAGGRGMSEREIASVMQGFSGRRALMKGTSGKRGDVFRYREFMTDIQAAERDSVQMEVV